MEEQNKDWWKGAVIYQIYPRSFKDSNGDGIGDLKGITENFEYISDLGVDAIWISPFFKSPMDDFGYDISDYRAIDPIFGTMDDFDALLATAHNNNIKVIIDMVLSHTSFQHEWFKESRQSNDNPKSNWYVWADPNKDGTPPNNWLSVFGGPAWTFESRRQQYYMHNWLKTMPDLNFHNQEVQNAILEECKFWLDKGVDGFRLDVINFIFHDQKLRNNPPKNPFEEGFAHQLEKLDPYNMQHHIFDKTRPEAFSFIQKLRELSDGYDSRFLLAEIGDDDALTTSLEYTAGHNHFHTAYSFSYMLGDHITPRIVDDIYQKFHLHAENKGNWPTWAFSNHDVIRVASRWGDKLGFTSNRAFQKMLITLLLSLRGTICLYQGEELGLKDSEIAFEDIQDPWGKQLWPEWQGRDGCRTPMPWSHNLKHGGFTQEMHSPWLPVDKDHIENAVDVQKDNDNSILNYTKTFLRLRKQYPALVKGEYSYHDSENEHVLIMERVLDGHDSVIGLFNMTDSEQTIASFPEYDDVIWGKNVETLSAFEVTLVTKKR